MVEYCRISRLILVYIPVRSADDGLIYCSGNKWG